jgi:hypothetical protein
MPKFGVIPLVSPTVQKAETSSKTKSKTGTVGSNQDKKKTEIRINEAENTKIVYALLSNSKEMLRPPSSRLFFPRIVALMASRMTINVEVLIPPAVDPDDPPMNIRKMRRITAGADSIPISTVLNPAVRGETDWKIA